MAEDPRRRGEVLSEVFERVEGDWPEMAPEPEEEPSEDWAKEPGTHEGPITRFLDERDRHGS